MRNLAVPKRNFEIRETGSRERILKVLEPDAGKLARPVLKGENHGNVIFLPTDIVAYVQTVFGIVYTVPGMRSWLQRHGFSYKKPAIVPGYEDTEGTERRKRHPLYHFSLCFQGVPSNF